MKKFETVAATAFGLVFLGLAFAVAIETASRRLFNISLQGVDELGGYALAVGGALSFSIALQTRAHIRIDIVHEHLPRALRILLNLLASLALFLCAGALVLMAWIALSDSILFSSTAQTPWATPLRYPQSVWLATLALFALFAVLQLVAVLRLLFQRRLERIDREFSPRGSKEELAEELADIKHRGAASVDLEAGVKL
jgi:TRAP-type C4-dicarboxylate transport system permease small subunit